MRAVLRRAAFLVTASAGAGVLAAGMVVASAGPAAALPSNCAPSGTQVTCTFSFNPGDPGPQLFTVPDGVRSVTVTADGAQGGDAQDDANASAGRGGQASATFAVMPGDAVEVVVGGQGAGSYGGPGGFNGGGAGGQGGAVTGGNMAGGAGGGGASDVRTGPCAAALACGLQARVLVGGGGGGAALASVGGGGGWPSGTAGNGAAYGGAGGGGGGGQTAGGTGGTADTSDCSNAPGGVAGGLATQDAGGAGAPGADALSPTGSGGVGGAGGGGGYWGGGGGAGGCPLGGGASGGGGSSYGPPGTDFTGTNTGDGQVTISYQAPLYAAVTATGSGDCSDIADACTLDTALGQVAAGGTIELVTPGGTGHYVGNWAVNTPGTSASAPVTIEAVAGLASQPVLDGNGPNAPSGETCSTTSCTGPVLTVPTGEFVALSGVTIANGNNTTTFPGAGGGLDNAGTVTITGSAFTGNTARGGGAIASGINFGSGGTGSVTVTDSTFTGNSAGAGGAIDNGTGHGPGASGGFGTLSVTDSTFSDNTTTGDGGAIVNGNEDGGGTVTVTGSTFAGNSANNGGAINSAQNSSQNNGGGTVMVTDSTFSGNTASTNGGAIDNSDGQGGNGTVQVTASTFSGNSATGAGGAINNQMGTFQVAEDVFDGSCTTHGGWKDGGYNAGSNNSCFLGGTGDVNAGSSSALKLGQLADNGGPTQTIMPQAGSPVIGAIPDPTSVTLGGGQVQLCARTDQRGVDSTDGEPCTIGAVEVPTVAFTVTVSGSQAYGGTASFTATNNAPGSATVDDKNLTCSTAGGNPLSGLGVAGSPYTLDGSSCSGVTATGPDNYQINYQGAANGFTVSAASQTISFPAIADHTYGDADFGVTATASSGLQVTYAAAGQCTVTAGGTVHLTGAGSCSITASQAGNGNYNAATPVTRQFNIAKAPTTTALSSSPGNSWLFGQPVTFTATVSAAPGTPTGTVTFSDSASSSALCTAVSLTNGTATCTATALAPGSHTITAAYSGGGNFAASSGQLTQAVGFSPAACITKAFTGPLVISAGQASCVGAGAVITNGVTIKTGGALYLTGGTIKGSVSATNPSAVTLCGAMLSGNVTITGATGPLVIGGPLGTGTCAKNTNTISGSVSLTGNKGGLTYQNNTVSGSLTITGNTGGFHYLSGNKITGTVTIKNNS